MIKKDIPTALLTLVVLGLVGSVLWSSCARAGEFFEEPPYIYLGAMTNERTTYCHDNPRVVGHLGIAQDFYKNGRHVVNWKYLHHSCAFEENDRNSTDAIGITYKYYLGDW